MEGLKDKNIKVGNVYQALTTVRYQEDFKEKNVKEGDTQVLVYRYLRSMLYYRNKDMTFADDLLYDSPYYSVLTPDGFYRNNQSGMTDIVVGEEMSLTTILMLSGMSNPRSRTDLWKIQKTLLNGKLEKRKEAKKNSLFLPNYLWMPEKMLKQLDYYGKTFVPHSEELKRERIAKLK